MIRMRRCAAAGAAALVLLLTVAVDGDAQQRPRRNPRADTTRADTTRADTTSASREAGTDSIMEALKRLPGFVATEYRGQSAVYRANEGVLRLQGAAEVTREGDRLTADTIIFNDRTEMVEARGKPSASGQQQELAGDILFYDLARRRATALG